MISCMHGTEVWSSIVQDNLIFTDHHLLSMCYKMIVEGSGDCHIQRGCWTFELSNVDMGAATELVLLGRPNLQIT